ncbi:MAG TPA: hypothetical protein VGD63_09625 [Steroidobacteraceae bacterium]
MRPILGAALMLAGVAGLAYKVISGYRHPAPESFVSFEDRNKLPAASAADHPVAVAQTAPIDPAPPVEAGSAASEAWDSRADAQDNSECAAIKTEQHEIEGVLNKPHSSEESRYLQRRQLELAEQSSKFNCGG